MFDVVEGGLIPKVLDERARGRDFFADFEVGVGVTDLFLKFVVELFQCRHRREEPAAWLEEILLVAKGAAVSIPDISVPSGACSPARDLLIHGGNVMRSPII